MLSHSTKGSAKHADVDKMVEATRIAKEEHPELKLDGEFQLDAAISVLVKQKLTDLLHRESQNRSTTFPEDALQMISLVLLQLLLYSVRLRTNKIYISESYRIGEY